jgi:hypothetical protein
MRLTRANISPAFFLSAVIGTLNVIEPVSALDVRSGIKGHSLKMNWTEVMQIHRTNGGGKRSQFSEMSDDAEVKIYISEKGRVFSESSGLGNRGRGRTQPRGESRQQAPVDDDETDRSDSVTPDKIHWSWSGNIVTGTQRFIHGARQIRAIVSMSGNQLSCKVEIATGKSNEELLRHCAADPSSCAQQLTKDNWAGAIVRQGGRGSYQVLSQDIRDPRCEVTNGNIFAR